MSCFSMCFGASAQGRDAYGQSCGILATQRYGFLSKENKEIPVRPNENKEIPSHEVVQRKQGDPLWKCKYSWPDGVHILTREQWLTPPHLRKPTEEQKKLLEQQIMARQRNCQDHGNPTEEQKKVFRPRSWQDNAIAKRQALPSA